MLRIPPQELILGEIFPFGTHDTREVTVGISEGCTLEELYTF